MDTHTVRKHCPTSGRRAAGGHVGLGAGTATPEEEGTPGGSRRPRLGLISEEQSAASAELPWVLPRRVCSLPSCCQPASATYKAAPPCPRREERWRGQVPRHPPAASPPPQLPSWWLCVRIAASPFGRLFFPARLWDGLIRNVHEPKSLPLAKMSRGRESLGREIRG